MDALTELAAEATGFARTVARGLAAWCLRWALGFGLIAWATHRWPGLDWLWWAGGAVALISLVTTLVTAWVVRRHVVEIGSMLMDMELERLAHEALEEPETGDPREETGDHF